MSCDICFAKEGQKNHESVSKKKCKYLTKIGVVYVESIIMESLTGSKKDKLGDILGPPIFF